MMVLAEKFSKAQSKFMWVSFVPVCLMGNPFLGISVPACSVVLADLSEATQAVAVQPGQWCQHPADPSSSILLQCIYAPTF